MNLDQFTQKAQEAILAAQRLAENLAQPHARRGAHPVRAPRAGRRRPGRDAATPRRRPHRRSRRAGGSAVASRPDRGRQPDPRPARQAGHREGRRPRRSASRTSTSPRSTCSSACPRSAARAASCCDRFGASREAILQALQSVRGGQRVTSAEPGDHLPGAREVRPRPHPGGPCRQARPGHRPRRGDPPHHPGPQPAHEEQSGPHRRARRRQDRDRGGPRPADRPRRRARRASRTRRSSRWTSARSSRAPSSAASSRSASRPS